MESNPEDTPTYTLIPPWDGPHLQSIRCNVCYAYVSYQAGHTAWHQSIITASPHIVNLATKPRSVVIDLEDDE